MSQEGERGLEVSQKEGGGAEDVDMGSLGPPDDSPSPEDMESDDRVGGGHEEGAGGQCSSVPGEGGAGGVEVEGGGDSCDAGANAPSEGAVDSEGECPATTPTLKSYKKVKIDTKIDSND